MNSSFLFKAEQYSIVWLAILLFVHPFTRWCSFGLFPIWRYYNKVAVNICAQVNLCMNSPPLIYLEDYSLQALTQPKPKFSRWPCFWFYKKNRSYQAWFSQFLVPLLKPSSSSDPILTFSYSSLQWQMSKLNLSTCALTLSFSTVPSTVVDSEMCHLDPPSRKYLSQLLKVLLAESLILCPPSKSAHISHCSPHPVTEGGSGIKARPFWPNAGQLCWTIFTP